MSEKFYERIDNQLADMKNAGKYKEYRYLESPMSAHSQIENKGDVLVLCSNNYLGLADKDELVQSGIEALKKYGAGGASVRFICGTYDIHRELERTTADFLGMEAALTYTSCWNANTAVIPAMVQPGDTVISDALNHASIVDGCRLIAKGVNKAVYKHSDMSGLEEKLKEAKEPCPGLVLGKTTVIVLVIRNRRVLVTATSYIKDTGKRMKRLRARGPCSWLVIRDGPSPNHNCRHYEI
jgi:glycine C-acetyltransferase